MWDRSVVKKTGFPGGSDGKEFAYSAGDPGSIPGSGRLRGEGMTIHASMGELHGQRSLADCSTPSHGESDTIERLTRELGWGRSVVRKGVVRGSDHLLRIALPFSVYPRRRRHRFI